MTTRTRPATAVEDVRDRYSFSGFGFILKTSWNRRIILRLIERDGKKFREETDMAWMTPKVVEICIGMEINSYAYAEL